MAHSCIIIAEEGAGELIARAISELRLRQVEVKVVNPNDPESAALFREQGIVPNLEEKVPVLPKLEFPIMRPITEIDHHPHIPKHLKSKYGHRKR